MRMMLLVGLRKHRRKLERLRQGDSQFSLITCFNRIRLSAYILAWNVKRRARSWSGEEEAY